MARCPPRRPPRPARPHVADLVALGRPHGLDAVGVAPADAFATTRRHLERRKAAGPARRAWRSPTGAPSARPTRAALPGARALVVGARSYRRPGAGPRRPARRSGRVGRRLRVGSPATPGTTTTARCGTASRASPRGSGPTAGGPGCWPTTTPSSTARPPTGPGSAGTARTPTCCCPGEGSWFVLGSVVTDAPLAADRPSGSTTGAAPAPAASTAAPPAPSSPPAWSTPAAAWPGCSRSRASFPREHRVALGDRLYGCDDCQEVCPPNRRVERARTPPPAPAASAQATRRPARPAGGHRRRAARPPRPLVHAPPRGRATCAATPWSCWATWPTPGDPRVVAALRAGAGRRRRRSCGPTPCGRPGASGATTCCRRAGAGGLDDRRPDPLVPRRAGRRPVEPALSAPRRIADRDPPARHQRLPAQARRHPVLPVGAVAAARPRRPSPC